MKAISWEVPSKDGTVTAYVDAVTRGEAIARISKWLDVDETGVKPRQSSSTGYTAQPSPAYKTPDQRVNEAFVKYRDARRAYYREKANGTLPKRKVKRSNGA